jgi:peptidoglycan/xylan/chitin deacetylase (PgdA/CDA1 family)
MGVACTLLVLATAAIWLYFYDKEPLFRLRSPVYWWQRWHGTDLYQDGILWHGNRNLHEIALTFDDGPAETTRAALAALKTANIHATFFMVGTHIKAHPDIVGEVLAGGHEVGCHSYDHQPLTQLDEHHVWQQIEDSRVLIGRCHGHFVAFRPPWARWDGPILEACHQHHLPLIMYSFASDCFPGKSPEHWAHRLVNHVEDGSILLVHDTYPGSVEGLPLLLKELQAEGYHFVTITEMIQHLPQGLCPPAAALRSTGGPPARD